MPAKPSFLGKSLLPTLRELILQTRQTIARGVNAALVMLYWEIGHRIRVEILAAKRAEYGKRIVASLGAQLEMEFGRGFAEKNLRRMLQFAEVFPDDKIVASLLRQLGWTHFTMLLPLKDSLQRDFYAEMCRVEGWSTRTLREKIDSMLYERTALSRKPAELVEKELADLRQQDKLTPDLIFKDPYVQASPRNASNFWNWKILACAWPSISLICRPRKSFNSAYMMPSAGLDK